MTSILGRRGGRLALAAAAAFAIAAGLAYAAIPDASGIIHGCYRTSMDDQKGQLRVVEDPASCRSNELPIQWNEQGVAGPPGADGTDGEDGTSPTVAQLAAGDPNCPAGGAAITDAAGTTAHVCNGQDGQDGADGAPFSGTFTSPNGEYSISVTDTGVTVASPDSSIKVSSDAIKVESMGGDLIELRGGNAVSVRSGAGLELRGGSTTTIRAGGLVSINGGSTCRSAARVGDIVSPGDTATPGTILTGAPTVCIG